MRSDLERLGDILDAIDRIEERMPETPDRFMSDELLQVWAAYHLQVIGEAAARISSETRQTMNSLPWPDVVAMRNVIVHHYFGIDWRVIWNTVRTDLPVLKGSIRTAMENARLDRREEDL